MGTPIMHGAYSMSHCHSLAMPILLYIMIFDVKHGLLKLNQHKWCCMQWSTCLMSFSSMWNCLYIPLSFCLIDLVALLNVISFTELCTYTVTILFLHVCRLILRSMFVATMKDVPLLLMWHAWPLDSARTRITWYPSVVIALSVIRNCCGGNWSRGAKEI